MWHVVERISEKLFSKQNLPLIEMPLIDFMDSRRALRREYVFLDLSVADLAEEHGLELNQPRF